MAIKIIGEIIKKEFYQIRRDPRMLRVALIVPLMQVLLLGYAATTDIKNSTLVVCDLDRSAQSREIVGRFTHSSYFVSRYTVDNPEGIDYFIDHGLARVALVIPTDFGKRLLARKTVPIQLIIDGTDANTAGILLGYANQILGQYSQSILTRSYRWDSPMATSEDLDPVAGISSAIPGYAWGQPGAEGGRLIPQPRVWFNPDLRSANFMVPGVVALVLMIITMTLTSLGIVREKEIGTLEQLLVTPIKPYQLILGKLLPFTLIGFADVLGVLAIAYYWFEVPLRGNLGLLFGLSGLFILTTLGLGVFISTIAHSQQQAMLIAQFFFFMPFIFFSGFAFPIENMPKIVQYMTYLVPLRYFLEIIRGIFLKGADLTTLWPQVFILFVFGVVIFTLSVLRFQRKLE